MLEKSFFSQKTEHRNKKDIQKSIIISKEQLIN